MTTDKDPKDNPIIDLDADQVVEDFDKPMQAEAPRAMPALARKRQNWWLAGVALLAGAIGGGYFYKDVLSAYLPSDQSLAMSQRLTVLETDNAALKTQLASVEKLSAQINSDLDSLEAKQMTLGGVVEAAQQAQGVTAETLATLEQQIAQSKQAVNDLAQRPVVSGEGATTIDGAALLALQQRIVTLEKDVASLKVKPAEAPDNTVALSQNLADLKAKVASGVGYSVELERIQRMVPAAAGLDVLQQQATLGIADAKGLAGELRALIPSLPKPIIPGPVPESEGWWASIYDSLSEVITIRIEGDVDWPSAASAAAAFADAGDLPQAIDHLGKIEGDKPVGVQQWLDRAQARLKIDQALQSVEEAVLRVIAAKG
jgi:hypothetical protein